MKKLSLEQQFNIARFEKDVEQMTEVQIKEKLVELFEEALIKHKNFQELLKKKWGI